MEVDLKAVLISNLKISFWGYHQKHFAGKQDPRRVITEKIKFGKNILLQVTFLVDVMSFLLFVTHPHAPFYFHPLLLNACVKKSHDV